MRVSKFTLAIDKITAGIRKFQTKIKYDKWKGWVYLLPCLILLVIFTGYPIVNTVLISFQNGYNMIEALGGAQFSWGIDNFTKVISYSGFKTCLFNTVFLCVVTVPVSTILALIIAVCLNSIKFLSRFLQTIYFLPYVTNSIAIGMVFAAMFNMVGTAFGGENEIIQSAGIINNILEAIFITVPTGITAALENGLNAVYEPLNAVLDNISALDVINNALDNFYGTAIAALGNVNVAIDNTFGAILPINWINEGSGQLENLLVVSFYIIWNALPFKILILLGGLQSVNKQYYDAAKIDSTPKWRVFSKITVPLLSPMIAYVVITGFIGGFKEYSSIVGILGDDMGPTGAARQLDTVVGFIYRYIGTNAKDPGQLGTPSAAALILFGIIFVVTMINLYVSKKKTHF